MFSSDASNELIYEFLNAKDSLYIYIYGYHACLYSAGNKFFFILEGEN